MLNEKKINMPREDTILVVDDDEAFRESLGDNIASWNYKVITAGGGREALEKLKDNPVDLVLLDIRMPDMNGIECLSQIKKYYPRLKVVMMTAFSEHTQEAIKLGALAVLPKPLDIMALMALLELITKPLVLVVDDDRAFCYSLKDLLEMAGFEVSIAHNGHEVMDLVNDEKPNLIIMDLVLPDKDDMQVLADLRKTIHNLPVVLVTDQGEVDEIEKQARYYHDTFFFTKPLPVEKFLERVVEIGKHNRN